MKVSIWNLQSAKVNNSYTSGLLRFSWNYNGNKSTCMDPTIGVPIEDSGMKTTPTIPEEIAEYDEEESNLDEDASPMGKQKSGIAASMLKTLDRMANAAESHNAAEAAEMSQTSEINGHFSIPNGIKILKNLRAEGKLDTKQFFYAVDLLRVQQERIIIMSFSESIDDLVGWILYKSELDKNSSD
ncbi:hypothetical protein K1719_034934 [Acacia pycnantha]|nr:hypothetical protein K1719_034934 [Acacia pycnantha]